MVWFFDFALLSTPSLFTLHPFTSLSPETDHATPAALPDRAGPSPRRRRARWRGRAQSAASAVISVNSAASSLQRAAAGGGGEDRVAVVEGVGETQGAREAAMWRDGQALGLSLGQHRRRWRPARWWWKAARPAFPEQFAHARARLRVGCPDAAEFVAVLEGRGPEMRSVADHGRDEMLLTTTIAPTMCPARRLRAGRAEAALEVDGGGAVAAAGRAELEVEPRLSLAAS